MNKKFTITIPTKNRLTALKFTLEKLRYLLDNENVHCIICDDGSTDKTFEYLTENFSKIEIIRNTTSKGIHYTRNVLLNRVKTPFALCIDDDVNFISKNNLEIIENYFNHNPKCSIIGFRIYWSKSSPNLTESNDKPLKVKSFGAGASVWRMKAWNDIPNYPEWFVFYGEEDFAAYHLFKKGWEVHYVPDILVHHRVDIKARKNDKDYQLRLRRSLRSGWYLYFLFYPWKLIPRKLAYTLWVQIKTKVFKGDWKATLGILQAIGDLIINMPRLIKQSNRLSITEFKEFSKLADTKLYWHPEDEQ